jgi:hypothetical protein
MATCCPKLFAPFIPEPEQRAYIYKTIKRPLHQDVSHVRLIPGNGELPKQIPLVHLFAMQPGYFPTT